jgi:hypothetical protein
VNAKAIVTEAASKYGIDPKILWGLYGTETNFGHDVKASSAGAVGPFQFEPATARSLGVNPYDFKSAAVGAARYLAQYKGRGVGGMLSAYNAGPGGGYQSGYVNSTLKNAQTYDGKEVGTIPQPSSSVGATPTETAPTATHTVNLPNPKAKGLNLLAGTVRKEGGGLLASVLEGKANEGITTQAGGLGTQGLASVPREPGLTPSSLPPAPANVNLKPVKPPVQVQLPGYITGKGFPKVEQAKGALERQEHHPVNVSELTKAVSQSEKIAETLQGAVHQTPAGPIFMPKTPALRKR